MNTGQHYILRAFDGQQEVITTTVAAVPGANSYPAVGQVIDSIWKVVETLSSPKGEYWISVVRL
jgi:hypothetical protein